jgi:hypothetical protein
MRLLLYGMQSSGASVLAFTLAQKPDSLAFVDIWNMFAAPELEATARDVVAKVVVTTAFKLEDHKLRFRPDATFLVLRHPADTYDSLYSKSYANESGLIDEKFALLEDVLRTGSGFDHIAHYEDFVFCPSRFIALCERAGWKTGCDALGFKRTLRDIEEANVREFPKIHDRLKYGAGNVDAGGVLRDRVRFSEPWGRTAHLPRICPAVFDHYAAMRATRGEVWHVPSPAILSCNLHAVLRELAGPGDIPRQSERVGYRLRYTGGANECRIMDTELVLCPATSGPDTQLKISGLPGRPFNRIRATVHSEHPCAMGTTLQIKVGGARRESSIETEMTLRDSDMRNLDLAFEPRQGQITLTLSARPADFASPPAYSGVCIRNLRLDQVAS